MRNRKEAGGYFEKLKIVLIVLSIFAAVKMLFFAFGLDEEYQLVMAYRNVKGDKLFLDMWEPHQSSAFLCALLMRPYLAVCGETGVVVWLRFCGTLIHLGMSMYLCRTLRRMISGDSAFLLGLIYFNTIPKQIMLPEFGMMQVWFLTLLSLFQIQYYDIDVRNKGRSVSAADGNAGKKKYLIFAAFALVLEVLSYPSCLILYFFVMWIVWRRSGKRRFADMGIFTGICAVCGIVYLALLLRHNTLEGLFDTFFSIVNGDITHSLTFMDKLVSLGRDLLVPAGICLGIFVPAKAGAGISMKIWKGKKGGIGKEAGEGTVRGTEKKRCSLQLIWITGLSCLVEIWYWVVFNAGYEGMQVHLAVFAILGVWYYISAEKQEGRQKTRAWKQKSLLLDQMVLAGAALAAVLYLTDLGLMDSLPHAMTAAFFGMVLAVMYQEERERENSGGMSGNHAGEIGEADENTAAGATGKSGSSAACVYIALFLWAFTAVFGKGYTLRSGTGYHNVLQSGGILKYGPAAGTISDYMCAYIYNCDYEDWQSMVRDGDRVLIMVDQVMNLGTIQYLFKDVEISHYSIVNPTAYDERLLDYWEKFPEKRPNVIIVDDWYGQLMTDPDGWLMRYAEGEFGYTSLEQGRYIRIYRKE